MRRLADLFAEHIVWGSDWPHTMFPPHAMPTYASTWRPVKEALGEAAAEALRLRSVHLSVREADHLSRGRNMDTRTPASQCRFVVQLEYSSMRNLNLTRRDALRLGTAAATIGLLPSFVRAQAAWPSKPIRFVVPFAPGGRSEIVARATAVELAKILGQSVYVDNKPGAAGNVAMGEVARADDEHTLILGHIGTLAVNPFIFDKLPYDANKAFRPITLLAKVPSLYVVRPGAAGEESEGVHRAGEVQAGDDELRIGRQRQRRPPGLRVPEDGERHLRRARALSRHRPAVDGPDGRRLERPPVGAPAVLQFIKTGKLRCIATGTTQRLPQLPDVPTVAEQGFAGFEMTQWYGVLAPASMSQANADKLSAARRARHQGAGCPEASRERGSPAGGQHCRRVCTLHRG